MPKGYVGYLLSEDSKEELFKLFPPKFKNVFAHHVTHKFGVTGDETPDTPTKAEVIGYVSDDSLEALLVSVDGVMLRPDNGLYHITWSLEDGRKPVQSNDVIKTGYVTDIDPIEIELIPKFFGFKK